MTDTEARRRVAAHFLAVVTYHDEGHLPETWAESDDGDGTPRQYRRAFDSLVRQLKRKAGERV